MYLIGSQYNIRIFRIMNSLFYNALRVILLIKYATDVVNDIIQEFENKKETP